MNMNENGGALNSLPCRFYRRLLLAYPRSFRGRFGAGMTFSFSSRWRDVERAGQSTALFWLGTILQALLFGFAPPLPVRALMNARSALCYAP